MQQHRPFQCLLKGDGHLAGRQGQCGVTDAKSLYDSLVKKHPASRQDRRTALELAVIIDAMMKSGSSIRWTPHQRMVADMLTKSDITKSNGALLHLLKHGTLKIDEVDHELARRQLPEGRRRGRAATAKLLREEEDDEQKSFLALLFYHASAVNKNFGELSEVVPTFEPSSM